MDKVKQIKLIEQPKEDIRLSEQDESSLFGGFYCPGSYHDGGLGGDDYCSSQYHSGASCGGASDYCGTYKSCSLSFS